MCNTLTEIQIQKSRPDAMPPSRDSLPFPTGRIRNLLFISILLFALGTFLWSGTSGRNGLVPRPRFSREHLLATLLDIRKKHGAWRSHNIHLGHGVYTIDGAKIGGDAFKLRRFLQIASDHFGTFDGLKVLDLACLEGLFGLEFAARGANAVGIEVRESSLAKARFARDALGLHNRMKFHQDDVRNVSLRSYGRFDLVIASGILYHLEANDAATLLASLAEMSKMTIIDTRYSMRAIHNATLTDGRIVFGSYFREHEPGTSKEAKVESAEASIDNEQSFWFTRASLVNLMREAGFTTVFEAHVPGSKNKAVDRITVVGTRGKKVEPMLGVPGEMEVRPMREDS